MADSTILWSRVLGSIPVPGGFVNGYSIVRCGGDRRLSTALKMLRWTQAPLQDLRYDRNSLSNFTSPACLPKIDTNNPIEEVIVQWNA